MTIIEVGNEYFRRGAENAKQQYLVRVGRQTYEVIASSRDAARRIAQERHDEVQR